MGRVGFEPTTPAMSSLDPVTVYNNEIDKNHSKNIREIKWDKYKEYLETNGIRNTVNDRYNYSIKYYHYLLNPEKINELLTFTPNKRLHIMKALSSLSKFCGCHETWKQDIKRHNIKWSTGESSLKVFDKIFNNTNYGEMLKWIKQSISILPEPQANLLVFTTLTGLRPSESVKCVRLIHNKLDEYWNKDKELLEHYKFGYEFIRRTKKVYVSVANHSIIKLAQSCSMDDSYNKLKLMLKRKGHDIQMYYCRKVFATFLRNHGVESEVVDLLQGRISSSVFVNHYYRPDINKIIVTKVKPVLDELRMELIGQSQINKS